MATSEGICPHCKQLKILTRDHIVPKWLMSAVRQFGISGTEIYNTVGFAHEFYYQALCFGCNNRKLGDVDYQHWLVNDYIRALATFLLMKVDAPFQPRKIRAKCLCKEPHSVPSPITVPVFEKVVARANTISSVEAHSILPATVKPICPKVEVHNHWKGVCWCGHGAEKKDVV